MLDSLVWAMHFVSEGLWFFIYFLALLCMLVMCMHGYKWIQDEGPYSFKSQSPWFKIQYPISNNVYNLPVLLSLLTFVEIIFAYVCLDDNMHHVIKHNRDLTVVWLLFTKTVIFLLCLHVAESQPIDSVPLCDNVIFLPGRWKGHAQQSEHKLKRIFQSYGKMSPFSKARPWTRKVTNRSRLQPITLIQPLVVKITNLSDVCVIRNNLLLAVVENWRLTLDWVVSLLLEVNNFFITLFPGDLRNIRFKTGWTLGQKHVLSADKLYSLGK